MRLSKIVVGLGFLLASIGAQAQVIVGEECSVSWDETNPADGHGWEMHIGATSRGAMAKPDEFSYDQIAKLEKSTVSINATTGKREITCSMLGTQADLWQTPGIYFASVSTYAEQTGFPMDQSPFSNEFHFEIRARVPLDLNAPTDYIIIPLVVVPGG